MPNDSNRLVSGQSPTTGLIRPTAGELPFSVTIPAGVNATISGSLVIDSNTDFVWFTRSGNWSNPGFELEFTYPDGTKFQNGTVYGPLVLGQAPFVLPVSPGFLCRAGSTIRYKFVNRTAGAITVDVLLGGTQLR